LTGALWFDRILRVYIMNTKEVIIKDGKVKEALMSGMFRIELDDGEIILATLSGKMRKFKIRILPGDTVKIEFSPSDLTRGRISYRYR
jgi:translation initiation factor IF-1